MNIFILHRNPVIAARMLSERKHLNKMLLESVQMLALNSDYFDQGTPYKPTKRHLNHPCTIWARSDINHYEWLRVYAKELGNIYYNKTGRNHKCAETLAEWFKPANEINYIPGVLKDSLEDLEFVTAMPNEFVQDDIIQSYRDYYMACKWHFVGWDTYEIPEWFKPTYKFHDVTIINLKPERIQAIMDQFGLDKSCFDNVTPKIMNKIGYIYVKSNDNVVEL